MIPPRDPVLSRRDWLGLSLGAGVTLALSPTLLGALRQPAGGKLIQRAIPSSGEKLPVIALGRGWRETPTPAGVSDPLKALLDNGGKVLFVHGGPEGDEVAGKVASELGVQNKIFWSGAVFFQPMPGEALPASPKAQVERLLKLFNIPKLDLVQIAAGPEHAKHLAVLNDLKKEGLVRSIGVTDLAPPPTVKMPAFATLEKVMRSDAVDFVSMDYSVGDRRAEEKILPLAQERKIAVIANFPLDRGRIFKRASGTPLPEWAADFDAKTWAQFFLKYVVAHPAVTLVRTGTSSAAHMLDNIGGGIGRLPNEATRERMAQLVDGMPPTPPPEPKPKALQGPAVVLAAAVLDRYVGEYKTGAGTLLTFRRDGTTLFIKPGTTPEGPLVARSETRFSDPRGPVIEFQVDGAGKVTGLVLEQGSKKTPASRV